jgi:2-(1,2-epoxy-1,2-dihydrophenyl)acetyl-CoA isomerase
VALVEYVVRDGVAHIRLNRPEASNAVDLPTAHELVSAVTVAGDDDGVRAVLVTGAGKRFCAGGDVASMLASDDQPAYLLDLAGVLDGALQSLAALEKPVVAAVQGAVAGAGLAVMLSCDLVVAEAGTKFVFAYPGVGLTPDCGVSWLLPRAVGQQRALELALTGRVLEAPTAQEWGLVTEVVVSDATSRAQELAGALAAGPSYAFGQARRLLRSSWESTRAGVGSEEARTIAVAVQTPDAERALTAFVNR